MPSTSIKNFHDALTLAREVRDPTSEEFNQFVSWCDRRPDDAEKILKTLCDRFRGAVERDRRDLVSVLFYFSLTHESLKIDLQNFATECVNNDPRSVHACRLKFFCEGSAPEAFEFHGSFYLESILASVIDDLWDIDQFPNVSAVIDATDTPVVHDPSILLSLLPNHEDKEKQWAVSNIIDSLVEQIIDVHGVLSASISAALILILETEYFDITISKIENFIFSNTEKGAEHKRGEAFGLFLASALYYFEQNSDSYERSINFGDREVTVINSLNGKYDAVLSYSEAFIKRKLTVTESDHRSIDSKDAFYTAIQSRVLEKIFKSEVQAKPINERCWIAQDLGSRTSDEERELMIEKGVATRCLEDAEEGNGTKKHFLRVVRQCLSVESDEVKKLVTKLFDIYFEGKDSDRMSVEYQESKFNIQHKSLFSPFRELKLALRTAENKEWLAETILYELKEFLKERQSDYLEEDPKIFEFTLFVSEILLRSENKMDHRQILKTFVPELESYISSGCKATKNQKERVKLLAVSLEEMMNTRSWEEIMQDSFTISGFGTYTKYYSEDGILIIRVAGDSYSPETISPYVSVLLTEGYGRRQVPYTIGIPNSVSSSKFLDSYEGIIAEEGLKPPQRLEILTEIIADDGKGITREWIKGIEGFKQTAIFSPTTNKASLRLLERKDPHSVGIIVLEKEDQEGLVVTNKEVKIKLEGETEHTLREKRMVSEGCLSHYQRVIVIVPPDFSKELLEDILTKKRSTPLMGHTSVLFLVSEKLFDEAIERAQVNTLIDSTESDD